MKNIFFILFTLISFSALAQGSLPLPYPYQNVGVPAGPVDFYYRKTVKSPYANSPYTSLSSAKSILKPSVRYTGMTFFVMSSTDTTEYWFRRDTTWVHVEKKLSSGNISPGGADKNVQFNDSGTLNGTTDFQFIKSTKQIVGGGGSTAPAGSQTITWGDTNINSGSFGSALFGETSEIASGVGSALSVGEGNYINGYGGITFGRGTKASGSESFAGGAYYQPGFPGKTNTKAPQANGWTSFGWYFTDNNQIGGHGVNADHSAVIGGTNPNIPSGATNSVIAGGNRMKLSASDTSLLYAANFRNRSAIGSGDRMVIAHSNGTYDTQAIPSGGGSGTVNSGTTNQIAYYSSSGTAVSGTNGLPNGTTAITQNAGDNSTKVANTSYVLTAVENNIAWYKASNVKSLPSYFSQASGGGVSNSGTPWKNTNGIRIFRILGIGDSEMDDYWIYQASFENILGRKYVFSGPGLITYGQGGNNNGVIALNYSSLNWTLNDHTTGGRGVDAYSLISTSTSSDLVYTQTPSTLSHNKWTSVRVFWYGKTGGGTFTITIDSGSPVSVNTSSAMGVQYTEITGLSDATHTMTIHRSSGGTTEIELMGYQYSRSTSGLQFNKSGHLGMKATEYAAQDSATKVAEYKAIRPNMVIINYTNDLAKSGDTTAYKNAIRKIIRWIKASDILCSIAIIGPMPVNNNFWHPSFPIASYERQLLQVANSDTVGVLLQSKLWGTQEKAYSRGVYIDSTHLNPYGGAALMASILQPFGVSYLNPGLVTTMQQMFDAESLHKAILTTKDTIDTGGQDFVFNSTPNLYIKNSGKGVSIQETGTSTNIQGINRGVNDSFTISGYGGNLSFGSVFAVTAASGQMTAGNITSGGTFIMNGTSGNVLQKFWPSTSDTWFQRNLFSTSGFRWEGGNLTDLDGHNGSYFGGGIIKDYRGTNLPIFFSTEGTSGGTVYSSGISTNGTLMVGKGVLANSADLNKSYLQFAPGTSSQAPMIISSGTVLTSPQSGSVEYDGNHLYITVGSTRFQLDQQSGLGSGAVAGRLAISSKTSNYTITTSDHTVRGDTSGGNITFTLPAAASTYSSGYGQVFEFVKKSSLNSLTVTDGTFSDVLTFDGQYLRVQSDGTTYWILNN